MKQESRGVHLENVEMWCFHFQVLLLPSCQLKLFVSLDQIQEVI